MALGLLQGKTPRELFIEQTTQHVSDAEAYVSRLDKEAAKKAITTAAAKIFDEPDHAQIDSMINKAISDHSPKDTEDLIQIVINMMRSG